METVTEAQSVAETLAADELAHDHARGAAHDAADRIGRYIVLGGLGEGGMGVVYAAYDPELDRKVALKVLLPGRHRSARAHQRLLREAQALARLSHPNVVAVHDVGAHEGRVFIAMEFIAGRTLTQAVAEDRPSLSELLRLYQAAGQGLAAAHRAGLIHRDFKPDNVMVDRDGRVRVVDFGLALADPGDTLTEASNNHSQLTVTGALMGTPAYMAPEQHLGRPADARTDIFAFCVALYEHLYGERPFAGDNLVRIAAEVMHGRVRDPPRGAKVPRAIRRALLRGLARDPDQRPATIDVLLHELSDAHQAPRRRRRRRLITLSCAALLSAAAFAWYRDHDAHRRCEAGIDQIAEVWSSGARDAGARNFAASGLDYADDAWARISARFDDWSATWAAARDRACLDDLDHAELPEALRARRYACFDDQRQRLAVLLQLLTDPSAPLDADRLARLSELALTLPTPHECSAAQLLRTLDGPPPPSDAQAPAVQDLNSRLIAAELRSRVALHDTELAELTALVDEARTLGYRPMLARAAAVAAEAHLQRMLPDPAEALFLEALSEAEAIGDLRRLAAIWPRWILFLANARSAYDEARHADRRADALLERIGGDDRVLFDLHQSRASLARLLGDDPRGRREAEAAIELGERLYGPGHHRLADLHNNLGAYLLDIDTAAAEAHIRRAIEIWGEQLGAHYPKIAYGYFNLARLASVRKDHPEAERLYRAAIEGFQRMSPDHPHIGAALNNLASVLEYLDDPQAALVEHRRARDHLRRTLGDAHAMTANVDIISGTAEMYAGELDSARLHIERGLERRRQLFGTDHARVYEAETRLLGLLLALPVPDLAAARELAEHLLTSLPDTDDAAEPDNEMTVRFSALARLHLAEGRPQAALALLDRADRYAADDGENRASLDRTRARALLALGGDRERARQLLTGAAVYLRRYPKFYARSLAELDAELAALDSPLAPPPTGKGSPARRPTPR